MLCLGSCEVGKGGRRGLALLFESRPSAPEECDKKVWERTFEADLLGLGAWSARFVGVGDTFLSDTCPLNLESEHVPSRINLSGLREFERL
jgi:hypothetical protein